MGNRGCLAGAGENARGWTTRSWIICTLHPSKPSIQARKYTPLFFSDEASALAAGHRPCGQCRRDAFLLFCKAWSRASGGTVRAMAPVIDEVLHRERSRRGNRSIVRHLEALPAGAFVANEEGTAFRVIGRGVIAEWRGSTDDGAVEAREAQRFTLLTPPSIVAVLNAGYMPVPADRAASPSSASQ